MIGEERSITKSSFFGKINKTAILAKAKKKKKRPTVNLKDTTRDEQGASLSH